MSGEMLTEVNQGRPAGGLSRRRFVEGLGRSFFGAAVGGVLANSERLYGATGRPHHVPRVRSVIYLFMCGGVSHIDTFDPKDNRLAGTLIDAVGFGDNLAEMKRPVIPCRRTFTRYGRSGTSVSDWFPEVGSVVDHLAIIRSMWCHESNHFPAVIETATGHRNRVVEYPSFGSWISYALGSENRNLPSFVQMGKASSPLQLSAGLLGAAFAATPFQPGEVPIRNLRPPAGTTAAARDEQMRLLTELNRQFREDYAFESGIAARLRAYELAARMQLHAPEVGELGGEPESVRKLYGLGRKETEDFGRQLLLARRLAERGVRFIQICHAGGGNGAWDAHGDMESHGPLCRQVDQPIAGLIRDLKQRGMLDETLVVWTSEFGRTPWSQNTTGRDHNPKGFTSWLAGGGIRGGQVYGATDEFGYRAIENKVYVSDLHATILGQLGIDHRQLEIEIHGRPVRLVEDGAQVVSGILS